MMTLFLLWVISFCCTSIVWRHHISLYSRHFGCVACAKCLPGGSELAYDTYMMLWCKALPTTSSWWDSPCPLGCALPHHFPASWCSSRLMEPGRTHGGCSGSTTPLNASPSSPLITGKPLKDFTWILWVRSQLPFPGQKESPILYLQHKNLISVQTQRPMQQIPMTQR